MRNWKKHLLGYLAIALTCTMIGSAATLIGNPTAQAEDTVTVIHTSPFTQAVQEVRDSVVGLNNYQKSRSYNYGNWMWGNSRDYQIVEEEVLASTGSGVVVGEDGLILTNYHVIEGASRLGVTVNETEYDAVLLAYDETIDIAIVQVEDLDLPPVRLGDSDTLMVGDWAICIGNPLSEEFTGTVTAGIVSGLNRAVSNTSTDKYGRKETVTNTMIQVDAAINSGNSGGGMFSVTGELMGIPTLKYSGSTYSGATIDSIGMCIPINSAKPLIEAVLNGEHIKQQPEKAGTTVAADSTLYGRPRMGVTVSPMNTSSTAVSSGALPNGAYIMEVESGSPAEKAGMQVGDIIVDVNDTVITSSSQITSIIQNMNAGDVLKVKVYRVPGLATLPSGEEIPEGEYIDLEVTLSIIDSVKQ